MTLARHCAHLHMARNPVEGLGFLLIFSAGMEPQCEIWESKVIVS